MTRISYAQNYEDVMLARALRGVDCGFYIDVGAQDPVDDSVTKAFYEMGWRGINIEPVTHWFQRVEIDRPRDINLQLAVSDRPGTLHLFEVVGSGLSTTTPAFAQQHALGGHQIRESDVRCVTLDSICEAQKVNAVHFLKIDCEGSEAAALRGLSLQHVRPWIILLEATEPNSQKPAYEEWEPSLVGRGYHFVYADGLNRFYVADEHAELDAAFSFPPNVFDSFVRAAEATARSQLDSVLIDRSEWRMRAEHLHDENERREAALVEHRSLLADSVQREARSAAAMVEYQRQLNESVQREARSAATVAEYERQLDEAAQREARSAATMADYQRQLGESAQRQSEMHDEVLSLQNEIGRLHYAVAGRDREILRLNELIQAIHRSTSWRVTSPLRLLMRGMRKSVKGVSRVPYQLLRWPLHLARPLLRRMASWSWLRSLTMRVLGTDSRLAGQARLFLFGASHVEMTHGESEGEKNAGAPMTRQASRVLEEIQQAKNRQQRAKSSLRSKEG